MDTLDTINCTTRSRAYKSLLPIVLQTTTIINGQLEIYDSFASLLLLEVKFYHNDDVVKVREREIITTVGVLFSCG